jgi:hypothetical protein
MENILKEINAVISVVGSFVCLSDGTVAAEALPEKFVKAQVELAARIISQTFQALEISGQRVNEVELVYDKNRLIMRNLHGGVLGILCSRAINVPLLSFTANLAVKKLTGELRLSRPPTSKTVPKPVASSVPSEPAQALGRKVAPSPLLLELDQEVHRLADAARENGVALRALDSLAIWLCCPNTRALIALPDKRQIEFATRFAQRDSIMRLFEQAGYRSNEPVDESAASHRLHLVDAQRELNTDIFFDVLELDHRLDLTLFLSQEGSVFSEAALLLTRLQTIDLNDTTLREICALLLEFDLSMESQAGKINASQIAEFCLNDQGLAQTILKNLDGVTSFAAAALASSDQAIVVERVQRLSRSINTGLLLLLSHSRSSGWLAH